MNYGHHVRDLVIECKRSEDAMLQQLSSSSSSIGAYIGNHNKMASIALPPYNDHSVRMAIQDFNLHVQELQEQAEAAAAASTGNNTKPSLTVRPSIVLQNIACQRNKRGLLIYHMTRMQRIQDILYWQNGSKNPTNSTSTFTHDIVDAENDNNDTANATANNNNNTNMIDTVRQKHLCPAEQEFLHQYEMLMQQYMNDQQLYHDYSIFDLRSHCTIPPISTCMDRIVCRVIDTKPFQSNDDDGHTNTTIVLESGQIVNFTLGSTHHLTYSDCEEYIRCGALQIIESEETF